LFWRHEELAVPKSRVPWRQDRGPCGCGGEPELIWSASGWRPRSIGERGIRIYSA